MTQASGDCAATAARLGEGEPRDHGKCRLPLAAGLVHAGRTAFERARTPAPAARADSSTWTPKRAQAETSKTTTCTRSIFDRGGDGPYYTRPMAAGLPDLVDCARLAEDAAVLERVYELSDLPRLRMCWRSRGGRCSARFAFSKAASGRAAGERRGPRSAAAGMPALHAGFRVPGERRQRDRSLRRTRGRRRRVSERELYAMRRRQGVAARVGGGRVVVGVADGAGVQRTAGLRSRADFRRRCGARRRLGAARCAGRSARCRIC